VIVFFGGREKKVGLVSVAAVVVVVCVCGEGACFSFWVCIRVVFLLYLYAKIYVVCVSEYFSKEVMKTMMVL
jgi:hypothetical protein